MKIQKPFKDVLLLTRHDFYLSLDVLINQRSELSQRIWDTPAEKIQLKNTRFNQPKWSFCTLYREFSEHRIQSPLGYLGKELVLLASVYWGLLSTILLQPYSPNSLSVSIPKYTHVGSISVSGQLPTYPSLNSTTVNWQRVKVNVGLREG